MRRQATPGVVKLKKKEDKRQGSGRPQCRSSWPSWPSRYTRSGLAPVPLEGHDRRARAYTTSLDPLDRKSALEIAPCACCTCTKFFGEAISDTFKVRSTVECKSSLTVRRGSGLIQPQTASSTSEISPGEGYENCGSIAPIAAYCGNLEHLSLRA